MKSLDQRIAEVVREEVAIVPYNPEWLSWFKREAKQLRDVLPKSLIVRIEHFGSTAVPGLAAKPIVDMLVEVSSLETIKTRVAPILESKGYDYFWRPPHGGEAPPEEWYAWFIKRDSKEKRQILKPDLQASHATQIQESGRRTHHIHMVETDSPMWERLLFRDYLREFPDEAERYSSLKIALSRQYPNDRITYTEGKSEFIVEATERAKRYYGMV